MEMVLTKSRKTELTKQFAEIQQAVDANYLPRKNTTVALVNELARVLSVKGMTKGCGRCMIKDAARILNVLKSTKTETIVPKAKSKTKPKKDGED